MARARPRRGPDTTPMSTPAARHACATFPGVTLDVSQAEAVVRRSGIVVGGLMRRSSRAAAPVDEPPAHAAFTTALRALEGYVGKRVLEVPRILEDLVEHIDALVDDSEFARLVATFVGAVPAEAIDGAVEGPPTMLVEVAGPQNSTKLARIARLLQAAMTANLQLNAHHATRQIEGSERSAEEGSASASTLTRADLLTHPLMPTVMKRGLLGEHRAIVALLAVGASREVSVSRAVVDALVDLCEKSLYQHVRVLASIPIVSLPEDIVPADDRVDLAAAVAERVRAEAAYQQELAAVRAGGVPEYPAGGVDRAKGE